MRVKSLELLVPPQADALDEISVRKGAEKQEGMLFAIFLAHKEQG